MKVIRRGGWVFYLGNGFADLDESQCGKWMYFFGNKDLAARLCREAVETNTVPEAKHSDAPKGVCCFYLNGSDLEAHRRTIRFFLDHEMIRRTKAGRLYNISFKYDNQTRAGEYGDDFTGQIKLSQFLDLATGEWVE